MTDFDKTKFYRYEWKEYAAHDFDGELIAPIFPNPIIILIELDLIKETPKGYWIGYLKTSYKKWIPKKSKVKFAYLTKREAMINFIKRTERRIKILNRQVSCCKIALENAKSIKTV